PHLVPHGRAERDLQLLGDALGDRARGDPPRLGVPDRALDAVAELEADLGDLGGLAGARLAGDDDDLVAADRRRDVVAAGGDRQLLGVADRRDRGAAALEQLRRRRRPGVPARPARAAPTTATTAARPPSGVARPRAGL